MTPPSPPRPKWRFGCSCGRPSPSGNSEQVAEGEVLQLRGNARQILEQFLINFVVHFRMVVSCTWSSQQTAVDCTLHNMK